MSQTKVYTFYSTLLHKAREVGQARLSGDPERIAKAEADHDEYVALCKLPNVEMQMDQRPFFPIL
jgi:hypothetical protein